MVHKGNAGRFFKNEEFMAAFYSIMLIVGLHRYSNRIIAAPKARNFKE
jgi:hypothetical protein